MTAEQLKAYRRLAENNMVSFSDIKTVVELNAFRDLTKRGVARFARFGTNCGYILINRSLLSVVR